MACISSNRGWGSTGPEGGIAVFGENSCLMLRFDLCHTPISPCERPWVYLFLVTRGTGMYDLSRLAANFDLKALVDSLMRFTSDGVYVVDKDRRILYWNGGAERLTGYTAEEVVGKGCSENILRHCDESGRCVCGTGCPLLDVIGGAHDQSVRMYMHHAEGYRLPVTVHGSPLLDEYGEVIGAIEVFQDDTQRTNTVERLRDLERDAMLDDLTGLANRRFLMRCLHSALNEYDRENTLFGLLLIDVDGFEAFNASNGPRVGDDMLKLIASTLLHACRAYDTPARWSGQRFAVLVERSNPSLLMNVGERIRTMAASTEYRRDDRPLRVTVSVGGVQVCPEDHAEMLIERAEAALAQSKAEGRDRVTIGRGPGQNNIDIRLGAA